MFDSILVINNTKINNDTIEQNKIASFDLDNTIIFTKSKKRFAIDKNDWYIDNIVLNKLKELHKDNYKIIFFTNQNGIAVGKVDKNDFIEKCNNILNYINLPIIIIASMYDDLYRKPRIGMWDYIINNYYPNVDIQSSFYCGDAAGRCDDFSCSDYKFALNLNLKFYTPEQLFYNDTSKFNCVKLGFNPIQYFSNTPGSNNNLLDIFNEELNNLTDIMKFYCKNMIILIGSPASGKSSFVSNYLSKCDIINQDTLLTMTKCKKKCIELINTNTNKIHNIVIDNCNKDINTRNTWVDIANDYKYNIIMINFILSKDFALHINKYRSLTSNKSLPNIAIHNFYKKYEEPRGPPTGGIESGDSMPRREGPIESEYDYLFNIPFVIKTHKDKDDNNTELLKLFLI